MASKKEYEVMLSITMLETIYVEAPSKTLAVHQAMIESEFVAAGGEAEVFQVAQVTSHD